METNTNILCGKFVLDVKQEVQWYLKVFSSCVSWMFKGEVTHARDLDSGFMIEVNQARVPTFFVEADN